MVDVGGSGQDPGPPAADEREFTSAAQPGWRSWDAWSPELEFCQFAGMLQRMLHPRIVIETGVGVGRLTSHLDRDTCLYLGFESDRRWLRPPARLGTPVAGQMAMAQLVILDSDPEVRVQEIALWANRGRLGSACLVHDVGSSDDPRATHRRIRQAVDQTGLCGMFLANPRGGWLAVHP